MRLNRTGVGDDDPTIDEIALRAAINLLRDSVESGRMPSGVPLAPDAADLHEQAARHLETLMREGERFFGIVRELYRAVNRWTEDPNLLAIIGSWRDTMSDADTLNMLREYNEHPRGEIIHSKQ